MQCHNLRSALPVTKILTSQNSYNAEASLRRERLWLWSELARHAEAPEHASSESFPELSSPFILPAFFARGCFIRNVLFHQWKDHMQDDRGP